LQDCEEATSEYFGAVLESDRFHESFSEKTWWIKKQKKRRELGFSGKIQKLRWSSYSLKAIEIGGIKLLTFGFLEVTVEDGARRKKPEICRGINGRIRGKRGGAHQWRHELCGDGGGPIRRS
jgi:hypothetical protein